MLSIYFELNKDSDWVPETIIKITSHIKNFVNLGTSVRTVHYDQLRPYDVSAKSRLDIVELEQSSYETKFEPVVRTNRWIIFIILLLGLVNLFHLRQSRRQALRFRMCPVISVAYIVWF